MAKLTKLIANASVIKAKLVELRCCRDINVNYCFEFCHNSGFPHSD
jgi:hypothetical protein